MCVYRVTEQWREEQNIPPPAASCDCLRNVTSGRSFDSQLDTAQLGGAAIYLTPFSLSGPRLPAHGLRCGALSRGVAVLEGVVAEERAGGWPAEGATAVQLGPGYLCLELLRVLGLMQRGVEEQQGVPPQHALTHLPPVGAAVPRTALV